MGKACCDTSVAGTDTKLHYLAGISRPQHFGGEDMQKVHKGNVQISGGDGGLSRGRQAEKGCADRDRIGTISSFWTLKVVPFYTSFY